MSCIEKRCRSICSEPPARRDMKAKTARIVVLKCLGRKRTVCQTGVGVVSPRTERRVDEEMTAFLVFQSRIQDKEQDPAIWPGVRCYYTL
jgi:hypothetical protein